MKTQNPLTPTLSRREKELLCGVLESGCDQLPLPLGEGWGEGFWI